MLQLLLSRGADINATCASEGRQALHFAAFQGRESAVRLLLDGGANIHATTLSDGKSVVHSCLTGTASEPILTLLLARAASSPLRATAKASRRCTRR